MTFMIKDSSPFPFVVKVRVRQSVNIPLVYFAAKLQKCKICAQLESPLGVLTFLFTMLQSIKPSLFPRIVIKSSSVLSRWDFSNKVSFSGPEMYRCSPVAIF